MATIDAKYHLTVEDFNALQTAFVTLTRRRRISRMVVIAAAIASIGAGIFLIFDEESLLGSYFSGIGVLLILLTWRGHRLRALANFKSQRLGDHEITLRADENGFELSTEIASGRHKWEAVQHTSDLPGQMILWPNPRVGYIIPKRALGSLETVNAFVALVQRQTQGRAFP